ncbi:hypothetical protein [Pseudoduganella sp.]|uniref:hypothetical protein n=1 Tax=Pseudoduganella sp. TaxID=1880898 RepID=UPI0035AF1E17
MGFELWGARPWPGLARTLAAAAAMAAAVAPAAYGQSDVRAGVPAVQFGPPVRAANAVPVDATPLTEAAPPAALAQGAELVLVSGYEPAHGGVRVVLDRPGVRVLLVLSSYEKIAWQLDVRPGTTLAGVIVGGYKPSTVAGRGAAPGYRMKLPYAYSSDNIKFVDILRQMRASFGRDRFDAYRGSYSLPAEVRISAPDAPAPGLSLAGPAVQPAPRQLSFQLPAAGGKSVRWTLAGPVEEGLQFYAAPETSDGQRRYRIANGHLQAGQADGQGGAAGMAAVAALPANFPDISWPTALAYDSKRRLVSLVTLGGEGFMYRFSVARQAWHDVRSLSNIDLRTLSYDARADRYLGWTDDGSLLVFSGEGEVLLQLALAKRLPGLQRLYDAGNGRPPGLQVLGLGDDVVLYYMQEGAVQALWHLDLRSRQPTLTYRAP